MGQGSGNKGRRGNGFHGIAVHPGKGGESDTEEVEAAYDRYGHVYGEAEKWARRRLHWPG